MIRCAPTRMLNVNSEKALMSAVISVSHFIVRLWFLLPCP